MPTDPTILLLLAYHLGCIGWIDYQFRQLDLSTLDPSFALHPSKLSKFNIPGIVAGAIAFLLGFGLNARGRVIWRKAMLGLFLLSAPALVVEFAA